MTQQQAVELANDKREQAANLDALHGKKLALERDIKIRRAGIMAEITAEINGDGKPTYSNAEKREAELVLREKVVNGGLLDELTTLDGEIAYERIHYEHTCDLLKIAIAFAGN